MDSVRDILGVLLLAIVFLAVGFISMIIKHQHRVERLKIIKYKGYYYDAILRDNSACIKCVFHHCNRSKREDCDEVFKVHSCSSGNRYIIYKFNSSLNK